MSVLGKCSYFFTLNAAFWEGTISSARACFRPSTSTGNKAGFFNFCNQGKTMDRSCHAVDAGSIDLLEDGSYGWYLLFLLHSIFLLKVKNLLSSITLNYSSSWPKVQFEVHNIHLPTPEIPIQQTATKVQQQRWYKSHLLSDDINLEDNFLIIMKCTVCRWWGDNMLHRRR